MKFRCLVSLILPSLFGFVFAAGGAVPMHVTHLWHMHQPIYYPYESVRDTDNHGRFNFGVVSSVWDGDRYNSYREWPAAAVNRASGHGGSQMSYSGSLLENNNVLWGENGSWLDAMRGAQNNKTSSGNPRLDTVGIAYHHSLMPLTCKESMQMQIRLHKEAFADAGLGYSKGFWPPECAFDSSMIPALVAEGLEWVIVDSGHFFRTVEDFPWSSASSCRPNKAEVRNGASADLASAWYTLPNVWAPTKVLAPWSYQPHYTRHVDPASGEIRKIIAVPGARYEGNENGRGGYGAFKPDSVWGSQVAQANNNPAKPMLLLLHSDGDNYGMKNSDAWNGQHQAFIDMCNGNENFDYTSVQDYLAQFPPSPADVIHVEPGSWIGIDGGTPYYEKWLSYENRDGEMPDMWSWSVLVATQNRVLTADDLENSYLPGNRSMNDVQWGVGNDTAKAWHFYLNGETSCYWYWDFDRANPWDGNVTRACNMANAHASAVIARHPDGDVRGPAIFPPQRTPYNPGGKMWDETTNAPNAFAVWTFADDVSGIASVTLRWRRDLDGKWPLSSTENETYAGGPGVGAWNDVEMVGDWWPTVQGVKCDTPSARAKRYMATLDAPGESLIDYYVEAIDSKGNITRSNIQHVWVGDQAGGTGGGGSGGGSSLWVRGASSYPTNGAVTADDSIWMNAEAGPAGSLTDIHVAYSIDAGASWSNVPMTVNPEWTSQIGGNYFHASIGPFPDGTAIRYAIEATDGTNTIRDDNGGAGHRLTIGVAAPTIALDPAVPVAGEALTVTYNPAGRILENATAVYIHHAYNNANWTTVPGDSMTAAGANWAFTYTVPSNAATLTFCFNNGGSTWDANDALNWSFDVSGTVTNPPAPVTNLTDIVTLSPANPRDSEPVTVTYHHSNRPLATATAVYIHYGCNDVWTIVPGEAMTLADGVWTRTLQPRPGTTNLAICFNDGGSVWDNNNALNWSFDVTGAYPPLPAGFAITNPAANLSLPNSTTHYTLQGRATGITGNLEWTNLLTAQSGTLPAETPWSLNVPLDVGDNEIRVTAGTETGTTYPAQDDPTAYTNGWTDGSNAGTGFTPWQILAVDGHSGNWIATSNDISYFALWSHETNLVETIRPFSASLTAGDTFRVHVRNGWIWEGTAGTGAGGVGVALQDADGTTLWQFYFNGGDTHYQTSTGPTDIQWTDQGIDIAFTLAEGNAYSVRLAPCDGQAPVTLTGTLDAPAARFRAWSWSNGTNDENNWRRDFFFKDLQVARIGNAETASVILTRRAPDATTLGIPDTWIAEFLPAEYPLTADSDFDGDGILDRAEYFADTDPAILDALQVIILDPAAARLQMYKKTADRAVTYHLQTATALDPSTRQWDWSLQKTIVSTNGSIDLSDLDLSAITLLRVLVTIPAP